MARFNTPRTGAQAVSVVRSTGERGRNANGGIGFKRDVRSELFLGSVSSLMEDTFYETARARNDRLRPLIAQVAVEDPAWVLGLVGWLRSKANLRSVSIFLAAEAVKARLAAGQDGVSRQIVAASIRRADEPSEFLAYWTTNVSRTVPKAVKRGVADGARATYSEYGWLKNKGRAERGQFGMVDVLNLTHVKPRDDRQAALFSYMVEDAYGREATVENLPLLAGRREFAAMDRKARAEFLGAEDASERLRRMGMTWEALAGFMGRLDAQAWEAVIPTMGCQALMKNLRNMEGAGVREDVLESVSKRLMDPDEVVKARILPMDLLSAYRNCSMRFHWPLEKALNLTLANVPALRGRTLVLVDESGSMGNLLSAKGTLKRVDAASIFGAALALRAEKADLVGFNSTSRAIPFQKTGSVLPLAEKFRALGGTETARAVKAHLRPDHTRVIVLTDEQATGGTDYWGRRVEPPLAAVPENVPAFTWNLAGYEYGQDESGVRNRHVFGGLSDIGFDLIPMLEKGFDAGWPWE